MFRPDFDPGSVRPQDVDRVAEQGVRVRELLAESEEQALEIVGAGAGDHGHVRATAAADGRVLEVTLGPRAVREGSHALAEEILLAVRRAQEDAQRQADDLVRESLRKVFPGADPAALRERLSRILD